MKLRYLFQATGMEKSGEFATSGTEKGFWHNKIVAKTALFKLNEYICTIPKGPDTAKHFAQHSLRAAKCSNCNVLRNGAENIYVMHLNFMSTLWNKTKLRLRNSFCAIMIIHSSCSNHQPVEGFGFSMKITQWCGPLWQILCVARANIHLAAMCCYAQKSAQANYCISKIYSVFNSITLIEFL